MPNGREGDHPLTDMRIHGRHPFPAEIEALLRAILALDPDFFNGSRPYEQQNEWDERFFRWADRRDVPEGIVALQSVLAQLKKQGEEGP